MSFTEHRLELIREMLRHKQRVHVKDLVDQLRVSHESIRRDLRELETQGFARRVYGGAVIDRQESDQPFAERLRVGAKEKARIGEATAALIEHGMKVFIDEGTTALACLRYIEGRKDLTIVSNSLAVAAHFYREPTPSVRVLGGRLRTEYQATFGPETVAAMKDHFFDLAIIAISAVHAERGFMDYGEDEAIIRRIARTQAKRAVIVADSSKFGRIGSIHTFGLSDVHAVITGAPLTKDFASQFLKSKVDIIYA
ncbi:DeoR/GlpR family DNA-binding transcription regulator [Tardiphaga sp. 1201_B9_N1_1]|jgi:DeoR family glycerol-3-phosphate regulon repressor|uniref:DeoR/GlpR family DNA-binding transcription regulator n=1 Tax=Tardiphaga TaxID=1395974 RepID=UPI000D5D71C0|nr:DeoR/GlpR family DNA-binding transcription regulator [Tardiphaga robiniae]MDR6660199.1 DeoR family glycerol-3-phosphate regulon repressor [Tardiphaga robiniae]NUU42996.1 DeoR/GlpR transcriptional regulator [Tardiphaga robiniae]